MGVYPLVSVVIPTYNRSDIICATVENVLAQTYPSVEIIVVDDGSTDNTREELARFGDRIRVVSQENAGPAAARNRGANVSQGEFIAFQDSDDLWEPIKLEAQIKLLQRVDGSVPCCLCNAVMHLSSGALTSSFGYALINPRCEQGIWLNVAEVLATRFVLFNQAVVIRRKAWEKVKGFDVSLKYLEDYDLPLRLAFEGPWAFIRTPLVIYRPGSEGSFSRQGHEDQIVLKECEIRIFEQALRRAKAQHHGRALQRLLRRRLGMFRHWQGAMGPTAVDAVRAPAVIGLLTWAAAYCNFVLMRLSFPRMRVIALP